MMAGDPRLLRRASGTRPSLAEARAPAATAATIAAFPHSTVRKSEAPHMDAYTFITCEARNIVDQIKRRAIALVIDQ
jgi:hypothetical protein